MCWRPSTRFWLILPIMCLVCPIKNYVLRFNTSFVRASGRDSEGWFDVQLQTHTSGGGGEAFDLKSRHVVDARGFNYKGHSPGRSLSSTVTEIEAAQLPALMPDLRAERDLVVVVGGGKTGIDVVWAYYIYVERERCE